MRVVETLVVRDEADVVDAQIAYHLDAGVDFVIATDHESTDGTTEILEEFARSGYLLRIPEEGPVREEEWRTRMARLAATSYGADWILNTDADEFWWPRRGSLRELLASVPERYGSIGGLNRHFVPVGDDLLFFERMTLRVSPPVSLNDPTSPWRPGTKVAHRADPNVTVFHAGYAVSGSGLDHLPAWYPIDILHFPYRSTEQWARKTGRRAHGDKSLGIYLRGHAASVEGRVEEIYGSVQVEPGMIARGRELGTLVTDTRLRDRLRSLGTAVRCGSSLGFRVPVRPPSERGDPDYRRDDQELKDVTALHDATLVRLQRRIDAAALRADALEHRQRRGGFA